MRLTLLTWNVAGRVARAPEQAEVVTGAGADVVCLQELTPATVGLWAESFRGAGYHVVVAELPAVRDSSRPLGVLIAFVMFVYYTSIVFVFGAGYVATLDARRSGRR